MEQEFKNKRTETANFDTSLRIQINADSSVMLVENNPDFIFSYIGLIGLSILTILIFFIQDVANVITAIIFDLLFWGMLVYSIFTRRKIICSINKSTSRVHYFRGGVFNTKFDESKANHALADVTRVEMARYIRRYGDTFQVILKIKRWERLELTARNLSFSDCQSYAEKIRNFIDPALPIKAVD